MGSGTGSGGNPSFQWEGSKLRGSCSSCASMFDKYGRAYKAQEVNDSLDSVHQSALNEELVTGTTREDDAGDSKTSGSNVEDVAPSSEKDLIHFMETGIDGHLVFGFFICIDKQCKI